MKSASERAARGAPPILRTRRIPGLPVVSVRWWLRGGSRSEEQPGLALMTGRMLSEGTHQRNWSQLATDIERDGIVLQTFGSAETIGIAVDALSSDWMTSLELVSELIREASFPADRLELAAMQAGAELESSLDRPEVRTARAFLRQIYGEHPSARPLQGSAEDLERIRPDYCRAFLRASLGRGIVGVVAGDIDESEVCQACDRLGLAAALQTKPREHDFPRPDIPSPLSSRTEVELPGAEQAQLFVGHVTVPRNHPDLAALEVAAIALGAGPGTNGRLPDRIREREGLAYSAGFSVAAGGGIDPGRMVAYAGVAEANLDRAERAIREELERFLADGIRQDELDDARSFLLGRDPFRRETPGQWADLLGESELYGIDVADPSWVVNQLRPLTRVDVDEAVRKWIDPNRLAVTVGVPRRERSSS